MYDKPEFPPLLAEGMHPMSLAELENLCVTPFPLSSTRKGIMAGLHTVVSRIAEAGIRCDIWVDGSFLTQKIDPVDVDIIALIPAEFYDAGTDQQRDVIEWLTSGENLPRREFRCDTHAEPIYPESSPMHYMVPDAIQYWRSIYGRSVESGEPKGIAVIEVREVEA